MLLRDSNLNIFQAIHTVNPNLKIFSQVEATVIDSAYIVKFGGRTCTKCAESMDAEALAQILNGVYGKKWDALFDSIAAIDASLSVQGETISEHITETEKPNTTTTTTNEVSPYNSDDFSNNDKSTATTNGTITNEKTREYSRVYPDTEFSRYTFEYLTNTPLFDIIFSDANSILTLNIYESEV